MIQTNMICVSGWHLCRAYNDAQLAPILLSHYSANCALVGMCDICFVIQPVNLIAEQVGTM